MNGHASTQLDVLIIGAGISGINAAYRIQESLPDASYLILEGRHELGGTWSLFKYPGIRSDSDMYTFGYPFYPWPKSHPIASGESILEYLNDTADKFDIKKNMRYNHKVVCAEWREDQQRWKVDVEIANIDDDSPTRAVFWTKWILTGTGYYNYDEPLKTDVPGIENFKGTRVHPQFWPENLDYKDKKVVIIGSGATTITLMPALVDTGVGSVTQLQRSPSFVMSLPHSEPGLIERYAPEWFVAKFKRMFYYPPQSINNTSANLSRYHVCLSHNCHVRSVHDLPHSCLEFFYQGGKASITTRLRHGSSLQAQLYSVATAAVPVP